MQCLFTTSPEHAPSSGLGRYGDPVDPIGDLKAMQEAKNLLQPHGRMFLTIPVGPDVLAWNLHRRYGQARLPLMLEGWDVVERVGWDEARLTQEANYRQSYEPVFVLKPTAHRTEKQPGKSEL